ncbi:MAG TPA: penicillin-binding transpeptidase domain-containing protein [Thermoanaerobaculia bacterium]|jgi:cell division protein FtsI (penicillin-binding protein 3)|nr:penicillin-binding transpeptidase domain-containing protein [Thermoanaerobaculia bacterium]
MPTSQKRLLQLFAVLAAWAVIVIARLVQIQLVRHGEYVIKAARQQERTLALQPVRGSIVDRNGHILAESIAAESIYADPQAIGDRGQTARALASVTALQMDAREIATKLTSASGFVWIARQLPLETTAAVKALKLPGVYFLDEHRRSYPRAMLAANVVGYTGVDGEGLAGIEHSFDAQVRGRAGRVTLLRDARRGMYLVGGEGPNRPIDGNDVVLTIDSVVQFIAERALGRAVEQYHAAGGVAIVMDPRDGRILAMASNPSFDPNRYRDFSPDERRNRAVQDQYEPGSTFKVVTASAGLEEGVVTPSQVLDCGDGFIQIGNTQIHEHGHNRYGLITFEDVMVHSSNVGAIRVGLALGQDRFYRYIRRFGFGERSGVALPGEAQGRVRHTEQWSQLSNASMSIGQEIGATPLQVLSAIAAVANGGLRVQPRIVEKVVDAKGNAIYTPPQAAPVRVISEKTAAVLNEILKNVVARGTGVQAALAEHVVAGKTGTAQKAGRGGYTDKVVASFGGYVPADRPQLSILVVVDEPKESEYGGTVAAPAFKEIAESTLRYLNVPPSVPARTIDVAAPMLATFSQKSAPAAGSEVPELRGLDARAAVALATSAGFRVRASGSGVVRTQQPLPGEALPHDHQVVLTLAEGTR